MLLCVSLERLCIEDIQDSCGLVVRKQIYTFFVFYLIFHFWWMHHFTAIFVGKLKTRPLDFRAPLGDPLGMWRAEESPRGPWSSWSVSPVATSWWPGTSLLERPVTGWWNRVLYKYTYNVLIYKISIMYIWIYSHTCIFTYHISHIYNNTYIYIYIHIIYIYIHTCMYERGVHYNCKHRRIRDIGVNSVHPSLFTTISGEGWQVVS
jgi:hypothetical protein